MRRADQASNSGTTGVHAEESLKREGVSDSDATSDDDVPQGGTAAAKGDDANDDIEIPQIDELPVPPARRQRLRAPDVNLCDLQHHMDSL